MCIACDLGLSQGMISKGIGIIGPQRPEDSCDAEDWDAEGWASKLHQALLRANPSFELPPGSSMKITEIIAGEDTTPKKIYAYAYAKYIAQNRGLDRHTTVGFSTPCECDSCEGENLFHVVVIVYSDPDGIREIRGSLERQEEYGEVETPAAMNDTMKYALIDYEYDTPIGERQDLLSDFLRWKDPLMDPLRAKVEDLFRKHGIAPDPRSEPGKPLYSQRTLQRVLKFRNSERYSGFGWLNRVSSSRWFITLGHLAAVTAGLTRSGVSPENTEAINLWLELRSGLGRAGIPLLRQGVSGFDYSGPWDRYHVFLAWTKHREVQEAARQASFLAREARKEKADLQARKEKADLLDKDKFINLCDYCTSRGLEFHVIPGSQEVRFQIPSYKLDVAGRRWCDVHDEITSLLKGVPREPGVYRLDDSLAEVQGSQVKIIWGKNQGQTLGLYEVEPQRWGERVAQ